MHLLYIDSVMPTKELQNRVGFHIHMDFRATCKNCLHTFLKITFCKLPRATVKDAVALAATVVGSVSQETSVCSTTQRHLGSILMYDTS